MTDPRTHDAPGARRRRPRITRPQVVWVDRLTTVAIKAGGSAVIFAVMGILVYLVAVVVPLFRGGSLGDAVSFTLAPPSEVPEILFVEVDEYRAIGVRMTRSGRIVATSLRTGRTLSEELPLDASRDGAPSPCVPPDGLPPTARAGIGTGVEVSPVEGPSDAGEAVSRSPRPESTVDPAMEPDTAGGGTSARHRNSAPGHDTTARPVITAFARSLRGGGTALGFADGTVRVGTIGFESRFLSDPEITDAMRALAPGQTLDVERGIVEKTPNGEIRRTEVRASFEAPLPAGAPGVAVTRLDYRDSGDETRIAVLKADGELLVEEISRRENMLTGEVTIEVAQLGVPLPEPLRARGPAAFLLLTSTGDELYLAWPDGETARFDRRDPGAPALAEVVDVVADPAATLTTMAFMIGEQSILAGDSSGTVRAWFRIPRDSPSTDGFALTPAHSLAPEPAAVLASAVSPRDKSVLVGTQDGTVILRHLTSEQRIAEARVEPPSPVLFLQLTPKVDGAVALTADGRLTMWSVSSPHPETTVKGVFGRVWYEGYPEPTFTWQSSSGTDDFEPKLSLVPLIFGTLKATLYSMLFAVPIALCAAIYTSEFLDPRLRAPIKSTIEMMASLPSVVLGFIAALVLAPIVESWVLAVLAAFGLLPLVALGFGYIWQALPPRVTLPLEGVPRFTLLFLVAALAVLSAPAAGRLVEALLFRGDFKGWLDGGSGTGAAGLAVLIWPVLLVSLLVLDRLFISDLLGRWRGASRRRLAVLDLAKYAVLIGLSFAGAWVFAATGSALGFDPRGELFGTYDPRNALVVGFVMGFAVIPIIYTISEDALSSVPQTLRSASLGCGATRWQTATRVVLPVAVPGIFSALMIGLGRAVGETMIVLMAAGNTPLIDLNVFNGLRTLSANIATELPEAVKDGTLYRMLFLAALCLFAITFVLNSVAEIIRQRFRKRAYQL